MSRAFRTLIGLVMAIGIQPSPSAGSISPEPHDKSSSTVTLMPVNQENAFLFKSHCASCHLEDGSGLVGVAPSIRNQDFLALASDHFIEQTIVKGRPGTAMVARPDLSRQQIQGIIQYLRSLPGVTSSPTKVDDTLIFEGDQKNGALLFNTYCSACHGLHGAGYMMGLPGTGIGLPGFLELASDDYIYQTLKLGRLGTPMQSFIGSKGLVNLSQKEAHDIIAHLRHLGASYESRIASQPIGPGNPRTGEIHYNVNCAACHQDGGKGQVGLAPSIRNADFLALANDDFIRQTVQTGRAGTGMMARPDLPAQTVNDIIAYLREAEHKNIKIDTTKEWRGDAEAGGKKFTTFCAACHGPQGEGYAAGLPGPAIGLSGFLQTASDDYIFQTLKRGRLGTPMRAFLGARGLANLSTTDIADIITHLRTLGSLNAESSSTSDSDFE